MIRLLLDVGAVLVTPHALAISHRAELELADVARQRSAVAAACLSGRELRIDFGGRWQSFRCM